MEWRHVNAVPLPEIESSQCKNVDDLIESKLLNVICFHPEYASPTILRADVLSDSDDELVVNTDTFTGHGGNHIGTGLLSDLPKATANVIQNMVEEYRGDSTRQITLKLVPRNSRRDHGLVQSVWILRKKIPASASEIRTPPERTKLLVIIAPRVGCLSEVPFYHPRCFALAVRVSDGSLSMQYLLPEDDNYSAGDGDGDGDLRDAWERGVRMSKNLLSMAAKHIANPTYSKRYSLDVVIPRERYQSKYQFIKEKHAKRLCGQVFADAKPRDQEKTFEELAIASWLLCNWEEAYEHPAGASGSNTAVGGGARKLAWQGFVDIGCGNGVLVEVLNLEGWSGWGFDARARKSWSKFDDVTRSRLHEMVLVPYILLQTAESQTQVQASGAQIYMPPNADQILGDLLSSATSCPKDVTGSYDIPSDVSATAAADTLSNGISEIDPVAQPSRPLVIHPGIFTNTSFLISNHGDELTPWTPLLASLTGCSFVVVPCCSHDLSGRKFRAPPPALTLEDRKKGKESAYQSLIDYVLQICKDVGAEVKKEWLRIPSTRNLALVGIFPSAGTEGHPEQLRFLDRESLVRKVLESRGGADGWIEVVLGLKQKQLKSGTRHL